MPGREIEFPTLVPKVQPSNCKFIMLSTMAKNQILAVQIHMATYLVFYVYDRTSTPKTNSSLSLRPPQRLEDPKTGPVSNLKTGRA